MNKLLRNWLTIFISLLLFGQISTVSAQCAGGGTYIANLTMLPDFQTVSVNAGERFTFDAYANITYIFSFCQGGGATSMDTQIEICDQNGTTVYEFNDDHCGLGSELAWTCTTNGTYSVVVYQYNCNASGVALGDMAYRTVTPPSEQDCLGAIPLCFNTYNTTASYSGTGHYWNEIPVYGGAVSDDNCPGNCLLGGEINDVWYTFTVQTSGTVSFVISPNDPADDYDWAVYDISTASCMDIATAADALQESCNFCGTAGDTGPSGGSAESCQHGNSCTNFNDVLNVTAGETYVVNVSNWSASQSGYTITFGGSAQIVDNTGPYLESLLYTPYCGSDRLTFQFSERVWCTSVQATDFVITGPEGTYEIADIWSEICLAGAGSTYSDTYYDDVFTLELTDYLMHDGNYTLSVNEGGVDDICSNFTPTSSLNFTISGITASATILNDIDCYGDLDGSASLSVSGGTPPYTYTWSNGETTQTAVNLGGNYSGVTVADSYGTCQDTVVIQLNDPDPILVDAGPDATLCSGGSVTIGGSPTAANGSPPYTYTWTPSTGLSDPNVANPTASPANSQTYIISIQDSGGCVNTDTVNVNIDPSIVIDFTSTDALCFGEASGTATANVSGGTPTYTYAWSSGLGTTSAVSGLYANTNYTLTVTDDIGCQEIGTITIGEPAALSIDFDITDSECGLDDGEITANVSGGTPAYLYNWDTGDTNATIHDLVPGDYVLTVTDNNACTLEMTATVNHYGNNDVDITQLQEIMCFGENTAVLEAAMSGGTGPFTYQWTGSSSTSSQASNLSAGNYTVTVTDVYGCPGDANFEIIQPDVLGLNLNVTDVLCMGGSDGAAEAIVNGGTPGYTFSWSNGGFGTSINNLSSGAYSLIVTDANACTVSENFYVSQPSDQVRVYVTTEPIACAGQASGSAFASATGGTTPYDFVWYESGFAISSGSEIHSLGNGAYTVRVNDDNGCQDEASFSIAEPAPLTIESAVQQASCLGYKDGQAAISVIGGTSPYNYKWSNGDTIPAITDLATGNYYLTLSDANGCVQMLSVFVPENPRLCLRIPNAFTPNGDGVNDTWDIEYIDNYPQAHVMVFNRWGQKMYDAGHTDDPWDGTFNGEKVPTGSYTYIVDLHNEILPFTGVVSVVH